MLIGTSHLGSFALVYSKAIPFDGERLMPETGAHNYSIFWCGFCTYITA